MEFTESNFFNYLLLPLLIAMARVVDVSIGTLKIILISRGNKILTPILGFFEVLVWLLAVTQIFQHLNNWVCYFGYAFGFATGSYVGIKIEEKLALGVQLIRIVTRKDATDLVEALRQKGFGVTVVHAEGSSGEVGILYSVINRKSINGYVEIIKKYNPKAFYTFEDIRFVSQAVYDTPNKIVKRKFLSLRP
jgi:uncharacterized protein YebE (UPF0316 family)